MHVSSHLGLIQGGYLIVYVSGSRADPPGTLANPPGHLANPPGTLANPPATLANPPGSFFTKRFRV
jgi:hypothetical protein